MPPPSGHPHPMQLLPAPPHQPISPPLPQPLSTAAASAPASSTATAAPPPPLSQPAPYHSRGAGGGGGGAHVHGPVRFGAVLLCQLRQCPDGEELGDGAVRQGRLDPPRFSQGRHQHGGDDNSCGLLQRRLYLSLTMIATSAPRCSKPLTLISIRSDLFTRARDMTS